MYTAAAAILASLAVIALVIGQAPGECLVLAWAASVFALLAVGEHLNNLKEK